MNDLKTFSSLLIVTMLSGCSTIGDRAKWDKETDSIALQITKSAGSFDNFKDRNVPKEALDEMSTIGYVGYTGLGMMFSTGLAGFGLALLSDNTSGWEKTSYIMFIDASKVPSEEEAPSEERSQFIARYVSKAMYDAQPSLANKPSVAEGNSSKNRVNSYISSGLRPAIANGWQVDMPPLHPCVYIVDDKPFVGTIASIYFYSRVIDRREYSLNMQTLLPFDKTIAVRYFWVDSAACFVQNESEQLNRVNTATDYYPSSPSFTLPEHTFISLPKSVKIGDGKQIKYPSSVRDNMNAYYFVKPIDGVSAKSPLADFHKRFVEDPLRRELAQ